MSADYRSVLLIGGPDDGKRREVLGPLAAVFIGVPVQHAYRRVVFEWDRQRFPVYVHTSITSQTDALALLLQHYHPERSPS